MEKQPKGYVAAFDDHDAAAAFRQVFETGKVTGTTTTTKKNDGDRNASGRTKESSNNTKYASTPMARARQERRKEEIQKVDGRSDSSSSPESTNNNKNNEFLVAGGGGILSKTSSLNAPIMNGVGSFDKLESSSTPSSGEGASVLSDKSERSEKSAMYQARAAKAARARESSSVSATTMGEEDGDEGEGEGGGTGVTSLKAGRFNRHLKDSSGDGAGHLPKFGDWNSKPPTASGPGYTVLFKAASKERRAGGSVRVPPPRPGSGSPPRTGDLYKLVPGRRPKKPNKLLCCIISTAIE